MKIEVCYGHVQSNIRVGGRIGLISITNLFVMLKHFSLVSRKKSGMKLLEFFFRSKIYFWQGKDHRKNIQLFANLLLYL